MDQSGQSAKKNEALLTFLAAMLGLFQRISADFPKIKDVDKIKLIKNLSFVKEKSVQFLKTCKHYSANTARTD